MKRTVAILLISMMALIAVACSANGKLVGTWSKGHESVKFNRDGTGMWIETNEQVPLRYTVDGDHLTLRFDDGDEWWEEEFTFQIDGNELLLSNDGWNGLYIKQ